VNLGSQGQAVGVSLLVVSRGLQVVDS
jgi:hypothetical protein